MKFPGFKQGHRPKAIGPICLLLGIVLLFCCTGVALGSSEADSGPKGWVKEDSYKVMNFVVLAVAIFFLLRKPVSKALNDRIQGIKDQLSDLEAKKKEAEEELAKYNEKFQQLDQEAEKLIAQYVQQGEEAKVKIIKEAETAAEKLEEQARRNIEHEFKKAKETLQAEVLEKALAKAEEMIKTRISTEDHERLVDEYLDKVVVQ